MTELRTAADFDALYAKPDPWGISRARRRDCGLGRIIAPLVEGKKVIELGCGEGHLTETILGGARAVLGVDLSFAAIQRAVERRLPNACYLVDDIVNLPLTAYSGVGVITALECLYYLDPMGRWRFFERLRAQHRGLFIMSAPIIGGKYFTHRQLVADFRDHDLDLLSWHNLNGRWDAGLGGHIARIIERLPSGHRLLQHIPDRYIYQRLYVLRCGGGS